MLLELLEALGVRLDVLPVVEALLDDCVHQRVQQRDVGAGLELEHVGRVALQRLAARVHHDQRLAAPGRLLEEGRGDRVVLGRVGADHHDHVGIERRGEGCGHRARADVLEQGCDRARVAEPRAVVDVVGAEAGPDQLLDQVGLLVRALGRAEARERLGPVPIADRAKAARGDVQRLLPVGLPEMGPGIGGIEVGLDVLGDARLADHRPHQAVRVAHVVEAEAALDAQPVQIGRAVAAGDVADLVVLDVVGDLAADPAVGADALDFAVDLGVALARGIDDRGRHQGAGRAGLDAFAAGDAGRGAHRVVLVEHDLGVGVAVGHADHVVDLDLAAGAHAQVAVDAGVQIDRHRRVAEVSDLGLTFRKAGVGHTHPLGPLPEPGIGMVGDRARGLVGEQQLHDHFPRGLCPFRGRDHLHVVRRFADAGRRQHPLALDLDHAGAAVAVGPVTGLGQPAQMRDQGALPLGHLPDGLAGRGLDRPAIERERDPVGHDDGNPNNADLPPSPRTPRCCRLRPIADRSF